MIIFNKLTIKNFLSIGNQPLVLQLDAHQNTLITAPVGSGKSSILDSICFCLFNKAYRKISKPQLVNSINGKQTVVEIEFTSGKKKFRVVRGIKPNIFEIYENGKLINQDASNRDYQKVLEQHILKMNYRAFTQVVVMGSASYVPFMKLTPQDRREFIEDMLDIRVFSIMSKMLLSKAKETKESFRDTESELETSQEIVRILDANVKAKEKEAAANIDKLNAEYARYEEEVSKIKKELIPLKEKSKELLVQENKISSIQSKLLDLKSSLRKSTNLLEDLTSDSSDHVCPTCSQTYPLDKVVEIEAKRDSKITTIKSNIESTKKSILDTEASLVGSDKIQQEYEDVSTLITEKNKELHGLSLLIEKTSRDIISASKATDDTDRVRLKEMAKKVVALNKRKKELAELVLHQSAASKLLQDSGVKAKIIKQYVPTINKLVNKYLNRLDLFCQFTLDEEFNEVVKSRHRDIFTYDSFSQGERQKIDISLIFTFREISAMKNSVNTNLIFIDELLDAAQDQHSVNLSFDLISGLEKSNVFVVSHREAIIERFSNHIKLRKKNNFTEIV